MLNQSREPFNTIPNPSSLIRTLPLKRYMSYPSKEAIRKSETRNKTKQNKTKQNKTKQKINRMSLRGWMEIQSK